MNRVRCAVAALVVAMFWATAADAQFASLDRQSATTQLRTDLSIVVVDRLGKG